LGLLFDEDKPARTRLTAAQQKDYVMRAGKCMACGDTDIRILDVHHIKPFAKGGSNQPWNLSVLCPSCHRKAQKGLIVPPALASKPARQPRKKRPKPKSFWDL
jgi:5-methylcytosine-specific restriction endonuclease McrA